MEVDGGAGGGQEVASGALITAAQLTICFLFFFYSVYVCETPAGKGQQECQAAVGREQCATLMSPPRGEVGPSPVPLGFDTKKIYVVEVCVAGRTDQDRSCHPFMNQP